MIRYRTSFIFIGIAVLIFSGCGIDDYIFLEPVKEASWTPSTNQKIKFTLPTSQTDDYFREYVIYYRLYPSTVDKSGSSFTEGDFSTINASMYADYRSVFPYSIEDDEAPVSLESLFENTLVYKELAFGAPVSSKTELNITVEEKDELETPLVEANKGKKFTIDYNLSALGLPHPTLIIDDDDTQYRILRNLKDISSQSEQPKPSRDFLQLEGMSGEDIEGTASTYTYAMFYIVARGIDETFSTILSRATFLGAIQLPTEEP